MTPKSIRPASDRAAPRRSTLAGIALVVALLWAQALGLWHRAAHAPLPAFAAGAAHAADHSDHDHADHDHPDHGHAGPHAFGHAAGDAPQCRLFDQLTLADTLQAAALWLPALGPAGSFVAPPAEGTSPVGSAPYQARAPPVFG